MGKKRVTSDAEPDILGLIMEHTHTQIAYLDAEMNFVRVNAAYARGCGVPAEELVGKNHFALFPNAENQAIFERVRDTGEMVAYQAKPFIFPNAPERGVTYWDWTLVPVKDREGKTKGLVLSLLDVTERKRAMERVEYLRRQNELILQSAGEGIVALDDHGRVISANPAAERMLGWPKEELRGKNLHELVHIGHTDGPAAQGAECPTVLAYERGITTRRSGEAFMRRDGSTFPVEFTTTPMIDDGRTVGAVVIFQDITERLKAEEALRYYAECLRGLQETDRAILAAQSAEEVARAALRFLREVLPLTAAAVWEVHWPSQEVKVLFVDPAYAGAWSSSGRLYRLHDIPFWPELAKGQMVVIDGSETQDIDGEWGRAWAHSGVIEMMAVPLCVGETLTGVLWLGFGASPLLSTEQRDMLERVADQLTIGLYQAWLRQRIEQHAADLERRVDERTRALQASERRFRAIYESSLVGIALLDTDGRFLSANEAMGRLLGLSKTELEGLGFERLFPEADRARRKALFDEWRRGHRSLEEPEVQVVRGSGKPAWVNLHLTFVSGSGEDDYIVLMLEDVTPLRRAHETLLEAERMAVVGRMAASLAHEINNPLQAVIGCLGLAEEVSAEGGNIARYLAVAQNEVRRAAEIIAQLRALPHARDWDNPRMVSPRQLVEHVLEAVNNEVIRHGLEVGIDMPADLPDIPVLEGQAQQVFLNVIWNAIEAMPDGGALRIAATKTEYPDGVRITIRDTGAGIDPATADHLFEPFYSTKARGLGLGLYLSREIMRKHEGTILVDSRPGQGTTVTLWFPRPST
ncbi:MAG: PAS domain S-box protein [Chloroflexi bacterium]|nr:PAS domain S-box protein [Chloroflexota bacterium]